MGTDFTGPGKKAGGNVCGPFYEENSLNVIRQGQFTKIINLKSAF